MDKATADKVSKRAASLWFTGILFSIFSSLYKLRALSARAAKAKRIGSSEKEVERRNEIKTIKTCVPFPSYSRVIAW